MIQEKECQESPNDLNDIAHQITDDDHIEIGAQNFRVIRDSRDYFPSRNLIKNKKRAIGAYGQKAGPAFSSQCDLTFYAAAAS